MSNGVVIAGGGLAGQRCCETLRARGFDGPITMVCEEPLRPYDRPPLSKQALAGEHADPSFRPAWWYAERDVELLLGRRAERLEPPARALVLDDGTRLPYDKLLIATGAAPRRLAALDGFDNVHLLRTLPDALRLREALGPGRRLAVVGAGFIGLEAAAAARALGTEVCVIEAAPTPLHGPLGPALGEWFADLHRAEGVEVITSARLERVVGRGRVEALELAGGRRVECDALLVGVGIAPAAAWLRGAGLGESGAGVPIGPDCRTRRRDVYAAGDVALPVDPDTSRARRSEHWESAARQGAAAARAMLGLPPARVPAPSFWSDQYGVRVQLVGDTAGADAVELDGALGARDFSASFTRAGRPVAVLLAGRPHALAAARRLIETPEHEGAHDVPIPAAC